MSSLRRRRPSRISRPATPLTIGAGSSSGTCPLPRSQYDSIVLGPRQRRPADGRADRAALRAGVRQRCARRGSRTRRPSGSGGDNGVKAPRLAFTTDSFVVRPLFFPGGDIGRLAVYGTVNDLAVGGAEPLFLSAAFILEEGLPLADLKRIVASMRAGVRRGGGVAGHRRHQGRRPRQGGPGLHHHRRASASCPRGGTLSIRAARPGDCIVVSGTIGDHGIAIMSVREGIEFETVLESDCAPLTGLTRAMLAACPAIRAHARPDPRRRLERAERAGDGLAAWASGSTRRRSRSGPRCGAPARCWGSTRSTSPTKGSSIAVVPAEDAERLRGGDAGASAGPRTPPSIGEVVAEHPGMVTHAVGGRRRAGRHACWRENNCRGSVE